jgi:hypothetical protein
MTCCPIIGDINGSSSSLERKIGQSPALPVNEMGLEARKPG